MTSWQDITYAIAGALALGWGVFVEWRLRQAQDATTALRTQFNDQISKDTVHALSDSDLRNELSRDIKGR